MDQTQSYATLKFIVRYGAIMAGTLSLVLLGSFIAIFIAYDLPAWTMVMGVGVTVVLYGLMRSYVEIVQVISETLLPR